MTVGTRSMSGQQIRAELDHPVIDADGHHLGVTLVLIAFIKCVGGADFAARFEAWRPHSGARTSVSLADRRDRWEGSSAQWVWPARTLDRATAALPRLYHERLDELGLDFSLVYPTLGLLTPMLGDDEMRNVCTRAVNLYMAETHAGLADKMLPVAAIPFPVGASFVMTPCGSR